MAGKNRNMAPMWKKLMTNVDLDEPTSFLDHVYLGCTQRECKPNELNIEEYRKMFESRISAGATEKLPGWEKPHAKTVAWSYDMEGHAQKCVERYCELANKKTEQLYKVSSPCLDDHHFKKEELESVGELSKVCSQIVLKCLYWARIGRPDILWSVNKLARAVTKWTRACDKRLARLISYIHHTSGYKQYCHVETRLSIVDWAFSKTQILLATLRTQNQLREESYVFLEVEHLFLSVGCARNKRQYPTVLQSQKLFRWMLVCEWMDYLRLIYGTW